MNSKIQPTAEEIIATYLNGNISQSQKEFKEMSFIRKGDCVLTAKRNLENEDFTIFINLMFR